MIHWGFGIATFNEDGIKTPEGKEERYVFNWLCPVPYFSKEARLRIDEVWAKANYSHKEQFPELCNGPLKNY